MKGEHCETIRDPDTGEIIASVHVTQCLTDEERAAMVEIMRYARRLMDDMPAEEHEKLERRQAASIERIRRRMRCREPEEKP